jgi:hypothetical protein
MLLTLQRSAENDITLEALPTVEGAQVGVVLFRPGNKAIEGMLCACVYCATMCHIRGYVQ